MPVHRKVRRLAPQNYFGRQTYFVTVCCDRRAKYLREQIIAQCVLSFLLECAADCSFRLHAFCVMPDHIHILGEGMHDRCDLREFVRLFKQRTGFAFRKLRGRALWEMSYHDHVLRSSDPIEDVACYIWWNPVRQKLCAHPGEFSPFRFADYRLDQTLCPRHILVRSLEANRPQIVATLL